MPDIKFERARRIWENFRKPPIFFAEGDSWFEYPYINPGYDLLSNFSRDFYLSVAHHGDEVAEMTRQANLDETVEKIKEHKKHIRAILFSGGGDDIVGSHLDGYLQAGDESD